ncbi:hypothetical protein BSL78_06990 [Apostichopus japonicus]|uniref:Ig-like domain-containing protein n=1 Tax=Stichopus japonicus TaxID=307972 RepID=A0A2G8L770_STIJA|nr:hypothetical protein BSL78_06990 [Apostichopus japonicus]
MESLYSLFAISLLFSSFHQVLCESQEVYFEIKDGNFNEVIFNGEKDITLICHVSNTLHADVTITKLGEGSVATNAGIGNCLEYNIQQVTEQNGGNYSCTSRFEDKKTGRMVEMSQMLSLNVRDNQSASCLRNGTGLHQGYNHGDILLLSCFCDVSKECHWLKTVVGSGIGESVPPMDVLQHYGKVIRRIIVGPLTSMDLATRYDCYFGPSIKEGERCSIGPADVSINDYISLPIPQSDLSHGCPELVNQITTEISASTSIKSTERQKSMTATEITIITNKTEANVNNSLIYITVALAILLLVAAAIITVLVVRPLKRNQNGGINTARKNKTKDLLTDSTNVDRQPDESYYEVQENPAIGSSNGINSSVYYSTQIKRFSYTHDKPDM